MNIILKKNFDKKYCHYYISKTGRIKFFPKLNYRFLCVIKNKYLYYYENFNIFNVKQNNIIFDKYIIDKLIILYNLSKLDLSYIIINKTIHIFHNKIYSNIVILLSIYIIDKNPNTYIYKYIFEGNIVKKLTSEFMIHKLTYPKLSDLELLTIIFYQYYIKTDEVINILLKYNKNLLSFENSHKLYIFLKKIGIVKKYFNDYSKKIIKNYLVIYKKIYKYVKQNNLNNYFLKKTKYFRDINHNEFIFKLIDKYINNDLKKKYIKNEFIKIIKNYNIK